VVSTLTCPIPPHTPKEPKGTATAPSGHSFILFQIRTRPMGVHPLDLSIGVHPTREGYRSTHLRALLESAP